MTSIEETVFESSAFNGALRQIRLRSVEAEFPMVDPANPRGAIDWNFALLYASALAGVNTERAQKAALRVAATCLAFDGTDETQRVAAAALLERVGNHRSVELAQRRDHITESALGELPPLTRLETIRRRLSLSIPLSTGEDLTVNPFQSELWSDAEQADWISVSAPTSAGKSHIVREWFLERLRESERYTAVYLAPTRALVDEVSAEFRRTAPSGTGVITMPWAPDIDRHHRRVLVLTQERLHLIQQSRHPFEVDLLFIDEAQGLGNAGRGILLQQVIDRALADHPTLQVIFASPLSENPEILLTSRPSEVRTATILSDVVTVNQNLIYVESVRRKPLQRTMTLIDAGERVPIAQFELKQRAAKVPMKVASIAHALGGEHGGNIVYVNDADGAEKVAKNIADLLSEIEPDEQIQELQDLVRTAVHPRYALVEVLGKGVAFHYGNMPLVIRSGIERLFAEGKIEYLVCTSTLLEGVNLPCRTIFMRNPQKGRGHALTEADFWNLAGRAGRWGKEFQGNIVCIDTDDDTIWPNLPTVRRRSHLTLATESGLRGTQGLIDYVRSGFSVENSDLAAENLFSYLAAKYVRQGQVDHELQLIPDETERAELRVAITHAVDEAEYPPDLIPRHAGISPAAMERLLASFRASALDPHVLALPLPEESDSRDRYQEALVRLGATMTQAFGRAAAAGKDDKRKWQLANLVVNWMNGMPLARLIEQRAQGNIPLAKAIRDVMADIETVARFQAPKYLSCYSDVLGVYASERGVHDVGHEQDITMLLELGVSRPSEVVLMSLGLSRTATVALAEYVTVDQWTSEECLGWLQRQNIQGLNIPVLIQREIRDVLEENLRSAG